ncbi:family 16 glycoside hydrolase [Ereboglobus luteus]|nr:family 16 glycoside hydrolase [Ereboglobus luteus]
MKKQLFALSALLLSLFTLHASLNAASGGIELGLQSYTFRTKQFNLTLEDALDRAVAMKIKNIQAYPGHKISAKVDEKFGHNMSAAAKAEVRNLFKKRGLNLTSYGVVNGKTEDEWRQIFAFAKEMGLRDVAVEPKDTSVIPLIAKLAGEYGVKAAVHNHAKPTVYADPEFALATVAPHAKTMGLCADTGHWTRSGYDPVATLRKAEGRLVSLHFKDLTERGVKAAQDMPWGTGASDAALQILELRRQGFKGIAYMEYENKVPVAQLDADTALCADWFHRALAASDDDLRNGRVLPAGYVNEKNISKQWAKKRPSSTERWPGPSPLFNDTLSNAQFKAGTWEFVDGVLTGKANGTIWTKENYGDFALNLDFRCAEKGDSGIILRCTDISKWVQNGIEVQIQQNESKNPKYAMGAVVDISEPSRQIEIEPGRWYHATVIAQGPKLQVAIDGERVINIDLSKWKEAGKNPDGTKNKFQKPYAEMVGEGRIGLQYYTNKPVSFRNVVVERIPAKTE